MIILTGEQKITLRHIATMLEINHESNIKTALKFQNDESVYQQGINSGLTIANMGNTRYLQELRILVDSLTDSYMIDDINLDGGIDEAI